ncbi:DUF4142 domain-containing protein [Dyadobacter luticola]|uniref:DUF4142 domain-containing protein n=1 Tax=Dyadobacter luticola TaxID=1979387 RepID=A0A5R9L110_9BACT|nr:DUF4142 domain-containing protein [Dyadobacter luticola]TLV02236.1 DUF4142 domain-containing protein [Dyadobacter luticola]
MKKINHIGLAIFAVFGLSYCSSSDKSAGEQDSLSADSSMEATQEMAEDSAKAQGDDPKLVYDLVESMYAGIAVMKQGEEKATSPAVKALAIKLVKEHTKLTDQLKALATKKGWTLPEGESKDDKEKREDLAKKSGKDYEKAWLEALADRHETNAKKLENAKPEDPDLKMAGEKGLPKIKELLGNIEAVQKEIK